MQSAHTLAAYQSPNGGDAIALLVNEGPTEMVRVDLTPMLNSATVPASGGRRAVPNTSRPCHAQATGARCLAEALPACSG